MGSAVYSRLKFQQVCVSGQSKGTYIYCIRPESNVKFSIVSEKVMMKCICLCCFMAIHIPVDYGYLDMLSCSWFGDSILYFIKCAFYIIITITNTFTFIHSADAFIQS